MNILKKLILANDKDFKVGDIVVVTEVTNQCEDHKRYCEEAGITIGSIMLVYSAKSKHDCECCNEERVVCNEVCRNKCIGLRLINNNFNITHSCYTRFKKIGKMY